MKRKALLRRLRDIAKSHHAPIHIREGGNHTVVTIGSVQTSVPRHSEINEVTAQHIIRYIEGNLR